MGPDLPCYKTNDLLHSNLNVVPYQHREVSLNTNVKSIISLLVGNTTMNIILKLVNVEELSKRNFQKKEEAKSLVVLRHAAGEESFLAG